MSGRLSRCKLRNNEDHFLPSNFLFYRALTFWGSIWRQTGLRLFRRCRRRRLAGEGHSWHNIWIPWSKSGCHGRPTLRHSLRMGWEWPRQFFAWSRRSPCFSRLASVLITWLPSLGFYSACQSRRKPIAWPFKLPQFFNKKSKKMVLKITCSNIRFCFR